MKQLLLTIATAATLFSCTNEQPTVGQLNTTDGFYSVDFVSVSQAGWAGGNTSDTLISDLCYLAFDYGTMFTINRDSVVTPIPLLGFNYTQAFEFPTTLSDTALHIGYLARVSNGDIHISRYTDYFGMGLDIQTLILTEL